MNAFCENLLENPRLFRLSQAVVAPGAERGIQRVMAELLRQLPPARLLLDVGCGPTSRLWRVGLHPMGVDCSLAYLRKYTARGSPAIAASAIDLPFASQQFDAVWSIGLLHHLSDSAAHRAVQEMVRVCRRGGHVVILDGVLPQSPWYRPVAYGVRRFDRGRFMRREHDLTALLPSDVTFQTLRVTYSLNGLELVACWSQVTTACASSL